MKRVVLALLFPFYSLLAQNVESEFIRDFKSGDADFDSFVLEANDQLIPLKRIGDLNGDGVSEMLVGKPGKYHQSPQGNSKGEILILFMNAAGTVDSLVEIGEGKGGFVGALSHNGGFGLKADTIGDLDNDGVMDIAVSEFQALNDFEFHGKVHILFLNADGTVKSQTDVSEATGILNLDLDEYFFGGGLACIGDLDGDGNNDLAISEPYDDVTDAHAGKLYIVFLNDDGSIKGQTEIFADVVDPMFLSLDVFHLGNDLTAIGDLNGDGNKELIVHAKFNEQIFVFFLNSNGTLQKLKAYNGTMSLLSSEILGASNFSHGAFALPDLNGDGIEDFGLLSTNGTAHGDIYIIYPDSNANITAYDKISASDITGLPTIDPNAQFGAYGCFVGDVDGNGKFDLAIGAPENNDQLDSLGGVYFVSIDETNCVSNCVYPGDCNNDGVANILDLFNIGLSYNETSVNTKRVYGSTNWVPQFGKAWNKTVLNNNMKYADADGNDTIDVRDIAVNSLNYGETHSKNDAFELDENGPLIHVEIDKDTISAKDTALLTISFGTIEDPTPDVYGVAVFLRHNKVGLDDATLSADFNNSWFGTESVDVITTQQQVTGGIDFALSKIDNKEVSGSGELATVKVIMPDNLGENVAAGTLLPYLEDVVVITKSGEFLTPNFTTDSVYVKKPDNDVSKAEVKFEFNLYPNPSTGICNVRSDLRINEVNVLSLSGQQIKRFEISNSKIFTINVSNESKGIYFVELLSESGIPERRMLVLK